jgi:hypothetical protein
MLRIIAFTVFVVMVYTGILLSLNPGMAYCDKARGITLLCVAR